MRFAAVDSSVEVTRTPQQMSFVQMVILNVTVVVIATLISQALLGMRARSKK